MGPPVPRGDVRRWTFAVLSARHGRGGTEEDAGQQGPEKPATVVGHARTIGGPGRVLIGVSAAVVAATVADCVAVTPDGPISSPLRENHEPGGTPNHERRTHYMSERIDYR
jgi:hypothetical protein